MSEPYLRLKGIGFSLSVSVTNSSPYFIFNEIRSTAQANVEASNTVMIAMAILIVVIPLFFNVIFGSSFFESITLNPCQPKAITPITANNDNYTSENQT